MKRCSDSPGQEKYLGFMSPLAAEDTEATFNLG